jgi:predicted TIM-barrel enzyme
MIGIGLSAKFIEKGGADLILVYNSGRFRMAGRGSLAGMMPYSDANQVVVEMVYPPTSRLPSMSKLYSTTNLHLHSSTLPTPSLPNQPKTNQKII